MRYAPIDIPLTVRDHPCLRQQPSGPVAATRALAEETPVALVYGGSTEAVMMASPADLEDFAVGFSFNEGVIERASSLSELTVVYGESGIELQMWLARDRDAVYRQRRRRMTGPTGCGLCGIESLAEAVRPSQCVADESVLPARTIADAVAAVEAAQRLNRVTHATHAAGFYRPAVGAPIVREDVGRHNALDKLAGALQRGGISAAGGVIVITSRVSVEMVQKAARIGAPVLIAISAPTALAVRTAEAANLTLVAVARGSAFQTFSHSWRIGA